MSLTFEDLLKEEEEVVDKDKIDNPDNKDDKSSDKTDDSENENDKPDSEDNDDSDPDEEEDKKKGKKKDVDKKKDVKDDDSDGDGEEDEDESNEDEGVFWDDVEKLTGRKVEVDYGDIDPESPEGAALREDAIERMAVSGFLQNLEQQYPREFRILRHAAQGGKVEDLYVPDEPDYSQYEIPEDDIETQREIMKKYYTNFKRLPKDTVEKLIEIDEDKEGGLLTAAKSAIKEWGEFQEQNRSKAEQEQARLLEEKRKRDMAMVKSVNDTIEKKTLKSFRLPDKEIDGFKKFAASSIQSTSDGYILTLPLAEGELEDRLQALYFAYKKGDLSSIIKTKTQEETARRLKKKAEKTKSQKAKGTSPEEERKEFMTINDLFN
jgi:hypothetical protein